jgi:hypothetical protein
MDDGWREALEYRMQEMKVGVVSSKPLTDKNGLVLPDSDERKVVVQDWLRHIEEMVALHDELEERDPDEAQRFVVKMAETLEECRQIVKAGAASR